MAYDERLAEKIRRALSGTRGLSERKMFGGLCFLIGGRMCCGIYDQRLVARVRREVYEETLARPHVRPMDFTGKPLRGFVCVMPGGLKKRGELGRWIAEGIRIARKR
jgi:hypothetical protein